MRFPNPKSKLWIHNKIGALVCRIEEEFLSNCAKVGTISLDEFVRAGALNYWLANFLDIVYARWDAAIDDEVLLASEQEFSIRPTRERVVLPLMSSLNSASQDLDWNRQIFADICAYRQKVGLLRRDWVDNCSPGNRDKHDPKVAVLEQTGCNPSERIFVSRTYLSRHAETLLAFWLGSIPVRWREPVIEQKAIDENTRAKFDFQQETALLGSFEHFVRSILSFHLPMSLVENFYTIQSAVAGMLNETPKVFFTAHLHVSSDAFLIWSVMQRKCGMRLLLSQHGGLNGQGLVPTRGEEFEATFADRYLHWGWSETPTATLVPAQLNVWARRRRRSNRLRKLIIITDCTYRLSRRPWASTNDNVRYRRMLLDIYGSLEDQVRMNTIVRLHHDHDKYDESHETMWRSEFPNVTLDGGLNSIWPLRRQARLLVCTSLGTSEIEQFARSMPTVLRLDPEVHALRPSCIPLFEELEQGGLVHWSTESFEEFIRENWDDIDKWWQSRDTQALVLRYLSKYGHRSEKPLRHFRQTLLEVSKTHK